MSLNKGPFGIVRYRTIIYGSLLLFLGFFYPGIPELRSNVCPENIIARIYPVDFFKVTFTDFRTFSVKQEVPAAPLTKKQSASNTRSQSPSDQCYFYEGHRSFADKGPETALLAFSGIFFGYTLKPISIIPHLPFVIFSSWTGNCIKIRPPPIS